jgi:defect-in-organelle-trafficking protein DotB
MHYDLNNPDSLLISPELEDDIINNMDQNVFRKILLHGYRLGVSDISFQEGMPLIIKKNNLVFRISRSYLQRTSIANATSIIHNANIGDDSALTGIMQGNPSNPTYTFGFRNDLQDITNVRYRINLIKDGEKSMSIIMRLNNDDILDLNTIGLSEDGEIYKNMFPLKGLNLITGTVDSGKTTLIYSCLKHFIINSPRSAFIDTLESPIEGDLRSIPSRYGIFNKKVNQIPVPGGVGSFSQGITECLRRNTDIIVTGEIRTPDEVNGVINGVLQTGKLIMGTMHTDNAAVSINRMVYALNNNNPSEVKAKVYDLLSSLNMVVSQKLLETVDKKRCAVNEAFILNHDTRILLQALPLESISKEIKGIMNEEKKTIIHSALKQLELGRISEETFDNFKASYGY